MKGVLGGALVPHAPQFFSLPETEDKATVERVRTAMGEVGERLAALQPGFVARHRQRPRQPVPAALYAALLLPPWRGDRRLVRRPGLSLSHRQRCRDAAHPAHAEEGFDPAFTNNAEIDYAFGIPLSFLGVAAPIVPLYVNSYIPPQPPMLRCYAFGQALARGIEAAGSRRRRHRERRHVAFPRHRALFASRGRVRPVALRHP